MTTLNVLATHDYSGDLLSGVTEISFTGPATATFAASQFDGIAISTTVQLTGGGPLNRVIVQMAAPGAFSAAGWTFSGWSGTTEIQGTGGADTITGSAQADAFIGGGGADQLTAGASADTFGYLTGSQIEAGEILDGGGGLDTIGIFAVAVDSFDFTGASITSVEKLTFQSPAAAAGVVTGNQIGAGGITSVANVSTTPASLIVIGSTVDLSSVSFTGWDNARDRITVIGTNVAGNSLVGSARNDSFLGGPGTSSADFMRGMAGNDTYEVDFAGDVVDESIAGSGGNDLVRSSISFSLANATHALGSIERLTLTGSGNVNGLGNSLRNVIIGNGGENVLNGRAGADTMRGRDANDIYVVDNIGDIVDESGAGSSGPSDTVRSSISFSLADSVHARGAIEGLVLTGTHNLNGTGNALINLLAGNGGNNVLRGRGNGDLIGGGNGVDSLFGDGGGDLIAGGAGNDLLSGGNGNDMLSGDAGNDRFLFNTTPSEAANSDHIAVFQRGRDKIVLDDDIFSTVGPDITAAEIRIRGIGGSTSETRLIYNPTDGWLLFDPDGGGVGNAVRFAILDNHPATLSGSDFLVVG